MIRTGTIVKIVTPSLTALGVGAVLGSAGPHPTSPKESSALVASGAIVGVAAMLHSNTNILRAAARAHEGRQFIATAAVAGLVGMTGGMVLTGLPALEGYNLTS